MPGIYKRGREATKQTHPAQKTFTKSSCPEGRGWSWSSRVRVRTKEVACWVLCVVNKGTNTNIEGVAYGQACLEKS